MVVSETLRKYPVFSFIERVTGDNYKIPGHDLTLEKGTPVYVSNMGLHYEPRYFPEPRVYDPERFAEENKKNIIPYTYLPFGEGPRMCIGKRGLFIPFCLGPSISSSTRIPNVRRWTSLSGPRLGLLETKYGLVQILRRYQVSPCEKTLIPMRLDPKALTITALGGLYLNMSKLKID